MEVCRACLKSGSPEKMILFDDSFVIDYNLLTSLNVSLFDGMSQYTCEICTKMVTSFISFREKCISSEYTLQQHLIEQIKVEHVAKDSTNVPMVRRSTRKKKGNNANNSKPSNDSAKEEEILIKNEIKEEINFEVDVVYEDYEFEDINKEEIKDEKPKKRTYKKRKSEKNNSSIEKKPEKKSHKKVLPEPNILPCGLCEVVFKTTQRDERAKHIESHSSELNCRLCTETFEDWPELLGHRIEHLNKNEQHCHICNKWFLTANGLEFHFKKHHLQMEKPDVRCKSCSRRYDNMKKLRHHTRYTHNKEYFECDHCSKQVSTKSALRSHLRAHSDFRSYTCDTCGMTFKQAGNLKDHIARWHSPNKATCKGCGRVFPNEENFKQHKCGLTQIVCPVCGISFLGKKRFNVHMGSHDAVGRHKCKRCGAAYKSRPALVAHQNKHDGIKAYKCRYCDMAFYHTSSRHKHHRTHTGEKPYKCKICEKAFTGNHNLKVHMSVHGIRNLIVKKNQEPDSAESIFTKKV